MNHPLTELYYPSGRPVCQGPQLAAGAEGSVYLDAANPGNLLKVFHASNDQAAADRERKLQAMLAADPELKSHRLLAWPQVLIQDGQGRVAGYVMRKFKGVTLVPLSAEVMMKRVLPNWTQKHVCRAVWELAGACRLLESHGVYIGDFNPGNFLTRPADGVSCCIDCDSFQVQSANSVFPSKVYTPEFSPPEILQQPDRHSQLGPEQFRFSAALFFFYLLTRGVHAYQVKGGGTPEQNILAGRFFVGPKGVATAGTTDANYARYRALTPFIKLLMTRTIIAGHHQNIQQRPNFDEWMEALEKYYAILP